MPSYTWKITDAALLRQIKSAENKKCFISPTFTLCNLRWYLNLCPNGEVTSKGCCNFYVNLVMIPKKVSKMVLQRKLSNQESGRFSESQVTFKDDKTNSGWPHGRLKTNEIQKFNTLTFTVDLEMLGVSDQDGNDITNQYLSKNDESKTESNNNEDEQLNAAKLASILMNIEGLNTRMNDFEKRMINMEKQMNEEQKINYDDKFDKIMNEIKWLKQSVNKISVNNNIDPEQQKLKLWLQNNVKLPQYYAIFIEAGIEDLETVSLVTIGTLKDMGIDKVGHQMKILNHVSKLKHKQNEGDTAYM